MLFYEVRNTTLSGLRVDADNSLVILAKISGVNGQVWDISELGLAFNSSLRVSDFLGIESLFTGVLMRPREGRKDKFSRIGMARMNGEIVALRYSVNDGLNIAEVQARIYALRV